MGRLEPLFCEIGDREVLLGTDDDVGDDWGCLEADEDAANAELVEHKLTRVWSMFQSDWMTDGLSNLLRMEMVLTTSSKEWGSALMMAMTASSS